MREDRVVRLLLRLYPKAHRARYGEEMTQTAADMMAAAPAARRGRVRARLVLDLLGSAVVVRGRYARTSMSAAPRAVRRTGVAAATLLAPVVGVLVANSVSAAVSGRDLQGTWLWSTPVLTVWILVLPAAALLVSMVGYGVEVAHGGTMSRSRLRSAMDVGRLWPVLLPLAIAGAVLALLFLHDSAHCWERNPVYVLTHWHRTWSCSSAGFLGGP